MKLGLILSHTGPMGLWTPGCEASAMLATAELNAAGGVYGREVELVPANAGTTTESAAAAARRLSAEHGVDAVIGMQPSNLRPAVRQGLGGSVPYIYTCQYEGGYCGPGTVATGITDWEVLAPAIGWLAEQRGARRFYYVGNDYIWPRVAHGTAEAAVTEAGGRLVGDSLLAFGERDYSYVMDQIRAIRPDVVISVLLGEEAVAFNRAFGESGMARNMLRLGLAFDESLLWGVAPENAENLYAVHTYFDSLRSQGREKMVAAYERGYGNSRPPVNVYSLGCYDGVHLAAALARSVGRVHGGEMARLTSNRFGRADAMAMLGLPGARRRPPIHIAEADGTEFIVRATV
ncbi:substrate-binding domain-containing protein [Paroceanicella profunda]|uniref:substrate-binding domain-containing protein n=1 Tax=Paroceanicella profunda TaxID=2579971 RepID=UPI001EEFCDA8|nr:substrate-binding domain-containing protein [Paroceanicella profunda]